MTRKQDGNLEVNQSPIFHPPDYCRYMGKFKSSPYGNDMPKQEKVSPFDAPCIG